MCRLSRVVDDNVHLKGVLLECQYFGLLELADLVESRLADQQRHRRQTSSNCNEPISRMQLVLKLMSCHNGSNGSNGLRCQGLNFNGADLSKLDLSGSNFKFSSFVGANLSQSNLSHCNFERAELSGARLDSARLIGVNFNCASLENASMKLCNFEDPSRKYRATMEGALMKSVNLEASQLRDANLRIACLKHSCLSGCNLRDSILAGANLEGCDLTGCDLTDANLCGANVKNAIFAQVLNPVHMAQMGHLTT